MSTRDSIERRIKEQSDRLASLPNNDESKRIKKRILQSLGKLKKQLAATSENSSPLVQNAPQQVAPMSNKKSKLKLKIVNSEIAELALKKKLKLARKRFQWLHRHNIKPGAW